MEEIFYKKILLGIRIKKIPSGTKPLTNEKEPLQLVTLNHPQGTVLKAHMHRPVERITQKLQECLVVQKGKIKLDLFTPNGK